MIHSPLVVCLNAKATTGVGTAVPVSNFSTVLVQLGTTDNGAGTIKFQGALGSTAPDFSATQSVTNHWDYIGSFDLQGATEIEGDTGIVFAGSDVANIRNILINTEAIDWLNISVTALAAGKVTAKVAGFGN